MRLKRYGNFIGVPHLCRAHQAVLEDEQSVGGRTGLFRLGIAFLGSVVAFVMVACSGQPEESKTFYIAGIPDQDISVLSARFNGIAEYLSQETGLRVEYIPSVDYAAVVTGFKQGDIQLGWYGGLTGVQARLATPNAQAIVQRPRDEEFRSVFIANPALGLGSLADVSGKSLTFGSESSTSGHLMPRHFLTEAGVDIQEGLSGPANYSGSHDKTWKLVETGTFQVGALNESVWDQRVASGDVDRTKVDAFYRTPSYYDYHWVIRGNVDDKFGKGAAASVREALLKLSLDGGEQQRSILEGFGTDRFIPTKNENYHAIENVGRQLGILER